MGKLVENPLLCKELGENAFRTIFRTYDDNYAKKLLNLYKNVIKEYNDIMISRRTFNEYGK